MTQIEKQILENQVAIMQQINHLYFRGNIIKSLNLLYPKEQSEEEDCCEMPKRDLTKEEIKELYNDGKPMDYTLQKDEVRK